ncbi:MAG: type I glyceraldehyde-3-phosphate dehydrogenase [Epsilonproteobacteria bacterium]|nr:MAG: type I glyceraldehyde-3-phosphate dehydrogenase [Campylobacterota bacterium]
MAIKIAINGFGRIGRSVTRVIAERINVELVAINDLASVDMMLYLLQNDSVHGSFAMHAEQVDETHLKIGNDIVRITSESDPKNIDFAAGGADIVLECTGRFLTRKDAQVHLDNGIEKVLFSAPANDEGTAHFVIGVNEHLYRGERILSNASCTTNCLAPIAKVLDDAFGIEKGLMTTIHSYTNDQNILDVNHPKEKRRSRAAALNMIPTTTGAAKAIDRVLPQMHGKLHGQSVRVPTPDVSMLDLTVLLRENVTVEAVRKLLKEKSEGDLSGIMAIDTRYRVSQDFVGSPYSSIIADDLTQVIDGNMLKIMAWYDNEWGYSNRLIDMVEYISNEANN